MMDPVQKALVAQLRSLHLNSSKVLRGTAVEPLHDLRIAALRAGFALKFFKKFFSAGNPDQLRDEFARARRVMAQRRDWDIFSSRIKKDFQVINISSSLKQTSSASASRLLEEKPRFLARANAIYFPMLQAILEIIKVQKTQAHQDLVKMLRSDRYKKMLRDLKEISSAASNKRKLKPQNLLKGLTKGFSFAKASEFHKIRITFKHLRYAYEFLADFYDEKKIQEAIRDIVGIQDLLGEHQDAETTVMMLSRLKMTGRSEALGKLIEIEKNYARQARKKFTKMYKSKRHGILKAGRST